MNGRILARIRAGSRIAGAVLALAALSSILSACLPFPRVIRGPATPASVFLPGVTGSNGALSPLQPTATSGTPPAAATDHATDEPPAASAPGLQGAVWQWTASTFNDGTVLTPNDPARYTLEFLPEGNALAQADCNFGTGLYKVAGAWLTIGAIGATKLACPADSLASAFLAQLTNVEGFALEGGELILRLKEDAGEMRLEAQAAAATPTVEATRAAEPSVTPTPLPATPTLTPTPTPLPPPTIGPLPTGIEV